MIIVKNNFFFSGQKFRIKKYLLIVKKNLLFFAIGIEKVFNLKNLFLAKNLLLQSHADILFA